MVGKSELDMSKIYRIYPSDLSKNIYSREQGYTVNCALNQGEKAVTLMVQFPKCPWQVTCKHQR